MDEEKIISKEMVLTLLLIFSIFGVIYLYCTGVDSWEKFSSIEKENCAEYHLERFINHLEERYTFERYNAALITSRKLTSKRKRNKFNCFINLWYGHLFRHVELDLKNALHYYSLASETQLMEEDQIKIAEINIEIAYLYHKIGNKKKRDHFLDKSRKVLLYCRNHKIMRKSKYLYCVEFDYISVRSCILGDERKFAEALQLLKENEKLEKFRFTYHRPLFPRAIIYKKMGNEQAFIKELERVDKTWKVFHLYSYYYLLKHYEKSGDYNKCIAFIEMQIQRVPGLKIKDFLIMELVKFYKRINKKEKAFSWEKKLDSQIQISEKMLKTKLDLFR